jgi:dTDP-4-dehydrorhamnose 3,5-epimerase
MVIQGVEVRELESQLGKEGVIVEVWRPDELEVPPLRATFHHILPGVVQAWTCRRQAVERIICLQGMIKLVLCDRREDSPSRDEIMELHLGEFRPREVVVPAGVLRGWKAVGDRPAAVFLVLEGGNGDGVVLDREKAEVAYDWEIVMQ